MPDHFSRDHFRPGNCTSIKECYPLFKLQNFAPEDSITFGTSNRCEYDGPTKKVCYQIKSLLCS